MSDSKSEAERICWEWAKTLTEHDRGHIRFATKISIIRLSEKVASALEAKERELVEEQELSRAFEEDLSMYEREYANKSALLDEAQKFIHWVIENSCFSGCGIDGSDVQEKAVELGILIETTYDPKIHGESDFDAENGDLFYVFSDAFLAKMEGK